MDQEKIRDWMRAVKDILGLTHEDISEMSGMGDKNHSSKSLKKKPERAVKAEEFLRFINNLKSKHLLDRCPPLPQLAQDDGVGLVEVGRYEQEDGRGYSRDAYDARIPGAIPELDVSAGAGEGVVGEFVQVSVNGETSVGHRVVAEWVFPDGYLRNTMKVSHQKSIVMEVRGDSMDPTIRHGDKVIVDLRVNTFGEDGLYLISDRQSAPRLKRLEYIWKSSPPTVKIISDNPSHREIQTIELEEIDIVGRVAGRVLAL